MADRRESDEPLLCADYPANPPHVPLTRTTSPNQHNVLYETQRTAVNQQPWHECHVIPARPEDYTVAAVLACIFCFTPVGLLAIFNAMQSKTMANIGQYREAERHSRLAKRLAIASLAIGITLLCMYVVVIVRAVIVIGDAVNMAQLGSTPSSGFYG
ncbi:uncharacterized protein LOC127867578 [Dreissena polymorpha]|uniref:Uncharacterized protein n=1 Tax=Dreissena polymorpha TaxID=45954 RepID=A0A9D4M1P0_DREPO|nr:uncharacterized protein LOC127867578 [Dreissena polymorpha]KAH3867597.1 hypothetical protein DPMN_030729 [Dreissena polymorpha]